MSGADGDADSDRKDAREATSDGAQSSPDGVRDAADAPDAQAEEQPALVLIVEDEEPIAQALAYVIREAGYDSVHAAQGKVALEILRTRHPALIITDLMMPQMDGAELIAAIYAASDGARPVPPIVLMTAGGMRRAEEAGADEVLRKPFSLEQIEDILERYITGGWQRPAPDEPPTS